MPVVAAERDGHCAACALRIVQGERIEYTKATGPRHLTCVDRAPEARRNVHRARCHWCRCWIRAGAGRLQRGHEAWVVSCLDAAACMARVRAIT